MHTEIRGAINVYCCLKCRDIRKTNKKWKKTGHLQCVCKGTKCPPIHTAKGQSLGRPGNLEEAFAVFRQSRHTVESLCFAVSSVKRTHNKEARTATSRHTAKIKQTATRRHTANIKHMATRQHTTKGRHMAEGVMPSAAPGHDLLYIAVIFRCDT